MNRIGLLALAGLLSVSAWANVETLQHNLKQQYPRLQLEQIQPSEMPGIYSARLDGQIVYLGEDARYILVGSMIRLQDQHNLTQGLHRQQNRIDWQQLPLQDAIKTVRGSGKHQLAVFSDPHCPYCRQLETELAKLQDVTIYTFLYPIRPQSMLVSQKVWCSANRTQAWQQLMKRQSPPLASAQCSHPIERNIQLGQQLGLEGTPALIFANGVKVVGSQRADQIKQIWANDGL